MITRALDPVTNDLFLDGKNIATVEDTDKVRQSIQTRLQFFLGEWFLDTQAGVAYFQEIFKKPVNLNNVESLIKTEILQTPGVARLNNFSLNFNSGNRGVIISFNVNTVFGSSFDQEVSINV